MGGLDDGPFSPRLKINSRQQTECIDTCRKKRMRLFKFLSLTWQIICGCGRSSARGREWGGQRGCCSQPHPLDTPLIRYALSDDACLSTSQPERFTLWGGIWHCSNNWDLATFNSPSPLLTPSHVQPPLDGRSRLNTRFENLLTCPFEKCSKISPFILQTIYINCSLEELVALKRAVVSFGRQ